MNHGTQRSSLNGPVGLLELAIDAPPSAEPTGVVLVCHPHPLHGGTLDNKVVQTLARACVGLGWMAVRFNFRGVGQSQGTWDDGHGEVDDALAVLAAHARPGLPVAVGGFSFGGYVATHVAQRWSADSSRSVASPLRSLMLMAPAVLSFPAAAVPEHTLLVHGQEDDVVPLLPVLAWAGTQHLAATVLPGAGHFFHGQLPLLRRVIEQHLRALSLNPCLP